MSLGNVVKYHTLRLKTAMNCRGALVLQAIYRVFLKKVLHRREEKMQEKIKTTLQKEENLLQVQQQCSVHFCIKMILES